MSVAAEKKEKTDQTLRRMLRTMVLIRRFEEKLIEVHHEQLMQTPVHLYIGQEAIAAGVSAHLSREDQVFSTHRNHGHCLAKGADPAAMFAEYYGRATGCSRGKGGSMHPVFPELGIMGVSAIVGGGIPLAVGAAWTAKRMGRDNIAVTYFGDGASEEGVFQESLGFAALKQCPVVFVCENNSYATNSPIWARQPHPDVHRRAEAAGVPAVLVDGNDVEAVYEAAGQAVDRVRSGGGPSFLECRTYRWRAHAGPKIDWQTGCRPREELEAWQQRCPIELFANKLITRGVIDSTWLNEVDEKIAERLDADLRQGKDAPWPQPEDLYRHVFVDAGEGAK